ncbi:nicotinate-nucleotide--dimethylbenzimidazole phosphoribosyltransferase [Embleya sp. NPDC059213]|uniref:nicotinate-nucleotide--dimethylbenzimidazole phosphoribosyltransferase n=1 Tax=Embleya sp. NPDC059213 TaxID=3346771 RepID=UPI00368A1ABE
MSEADERRPAGEGVGPAPARHAAGTGPVGEPAGPYPYDDLDDEDSLLMPGPQAGWADPNVPMPAAPGMSLADRMAAAGDDASGQVPVSPIEQAYDAVPGPQSGMFAAMIIDEPESPETYAAPMTAGQIPYPPGPMTPHQEVPQPVQGFGPGEYGAPQGVAEPYPAPAQGVPVQGVPGQGVPGQGVPAQAVPAPAAPPPQAVPVVPPPAAPRFVPTIVGQPGAEYGTDVPPAAPAAGPEAPSGAVPDPAAGAFVEQPGITGGRLRQRVRVAQTVDQPQQTEQSPAPQPPAPAQPSAPAGGNPADTPPFPVAAAVPQRTTLPPRRQRRVGRGPVPQQAGPHSGAHPVGDAVNTGIPAQPTPMQAVPVVPPPAAPQPVESVPVAAAAPVEAVAPAAPVAEQPAPPAPPVAEQPAPPAPPVVEHAQGVTAPAIPQPLPGVPPQSAHPRFVQAAPDAVVDALTGPPAAPVAGPIDSPEAAASVPPPAVIEAGGVDPAVPAVAAVPEAEPTVAPAPVEAAPAVAEAVVESAPPAVAEQPGVAPAVPAEQAPPAGSAVPEGTGGRRRKPETGSESADSGEHEAIPVGTQLGPVPPPEPVAVQVAEEAAVAEPAAEPVAPVAAAVAAPQAPVATAGPTVAEVPAQRAPVAPPVPAEPVAADQPSHDANAAPSVVAAAPPAAPATEPQAESVAVAPEAVAAVAPADGGAGEAAVPEQGVAPVAPSAPTEAAEPAAPAPTVPTTEAAVPLAQAAPAQPAAPVGQATPVVPAEAAVQAESAAQPTPVAQSAPAAQPVPPVVPVAPGPVEQAGSAAQGAPVTPTGPPATAAPVEQAAPPAPPAPPAEEVADARPVAEAVPVPAPAEQPAPSGSGPESVAEAVPAAVEAGDASVEATPVAPAGDASAEVAPARPGNPAPAVAVPAGPTTQSIAAELLAEEIPTAPTAEHPATAAESVPAAAAPAAPPTGPVEVGPADPRTSEESTAMHGPQSTTGAESEPQPQPAVAGGSGEIPRIPPPPAEPVGTLAADRAQGGQADAVAPRVPAPAEPEGEPVSATAVTVLLPASEPVAAEPPAPADPAPSAEEPAPEAPEAPAAESTPTPGDDATPEAEAEPEPEIERGPAAPGYDDAAREAVHRVMRERRDVRAGFRPDPVPDDVLVRVLEAAHAAPSVGYSQPWDFVVIRSEETRVTVQELAQRQREAYATSLPKARAKQFLEIKVEAILETPVNIVVTVDSTRGGRHTLGRHTQPQMGPYSSALAVENLWLAARAEGLGVGWVSFFDERELATALGLPEHIDVVAYLCVGYVDAFPDEPELATSGWAKARPLSWVVHEETYGRRGLPGEEPVSLLDETLQSVRPLDAKALGAAWEHQRNMTKPPGSLGILETIGAQLSGLARTFPPPIPEPAAVAVFAADHGVHAQGVSPWPQEVTAQMVGNFLAGGAVVNAFAKQIGVEVCVVDVGVATELPNATGLLPRRIRPGTADMTQGPAMTREEAIAAIEVGIETARDLVTAGNRGLLTGDMGIANTTASAALISVFTGMEPAEITGRGTGIDDATHRRKIEVVKAALARHEPDPGDPIGVLAAIGGLEHAALAGYIIGAAALRVPVVLDGVIAGAAALVAQAIAPESIQACVAGHRSAEPGHAAALAKLSLRPLVELEMRLGEGTGAVLALPLVQSAVRVLHDVATFDAAGVSGKTD